jgi:hypothetical protein
MNVTLSPDNRVPGDVPGQDSSQKISSLTRDYTAGVVYGCRSPKWVPLEVPNLCINHDICR